MISLATSYPVRDLGVRPDVLRAWAVGVEALGYDELYLPEHVLGIDVAERPGWNPVHPLTSEREAPVHDRDSPFLEAAVAFGFLAAVTRTVRLTSGVLVAPQRETTLLAKQLAVADVLSDGRVRLGIGVGWNDAEFAAMGANFRTRGRRMDEQIELLRLLWTQETVHFRGEFHDIESAGLCPLPVQRPIPIIVGGDSEPAIRRAARVADGWFLTTPVSDAADLVRRFWELVDEHGRSADDVRLTGIAFQGPRPPEALVADVQAWVALGATQVNVRTATTPVQWPEGPLPLRRDVDDHLASLAVVQAALSAGAFA